MVIPDIVFVKHFRETHSKRTNAHDLPQSKNSHVYPSNAHLRVRGLADVHWCPQRASICDYLLEILISSFYPFVILPHLRFYIKNFTSGALCYLYVANAGIIQSHSLLNF